MALNEKPALDLATENAKFVLIRRLMWALAVSESVGEMWEDYPEIGEHDWIDICNRLAASVARQNPSAEEFQAAYAHLAGRADH